MKWEREEGLIDKGIIPFAGEQANSFKGSISFGLFFLDFFFVLGLTLRLLGLLFNGMGDVEEFVFDWGNRVREVGLGEAFKNIYGVFSYFFFGIAAEASMHLPRFWWAPFKAMEIIFEIGIFWALYLLLPEGRKKFAFWLFWVNPYFILHGAWHGFWEGPHTLFGLLAILSLRWVPKRNLSWAIVGIILMSSAMFKPQGLIYFVMPIGIFLIFQFFLTRSNSLPWYSLGLAIVLMMIGGLLVALGGGIWAIPQNYLSAVTVMPNLCNDCINIWRPITRILQEILGQSGPTYTLEMAEGLYGSLHLLALILTLSLIGFLSLALLKNEERNIGRYLYDQLTAVVRLVGFLGLVLFVLGLFRTSSEQHSWLILGRYSLKAGVSLGILLIGGLVSLFAAPIIAQMGDRAIRAINYKSSVPSKDAVKDNQKDYLTVFLILAFAALLIPQIGTKAHSNHTYAGLVLLIPLALTSYRILLPWMGLVGIHFYAHLVDFKLGRGMVLPQRFLDYPPAQSLISKVQSALIPESRDSLLQFQNQVNHILGEYLPNEPLISVLSAFSFICMGKVVYEMFRLVPRLEPGMILKKRGD